MWLVVGCKLVLTCCALNSCCHMDGSCCNSPLSSYQSQFWLQAWRQFIYSLIHLFSFVSCLVFSGSFVSTTFVNDPSCDHQAGEADLLELCVTSSHCQKLCYCCVAEICRLSRIQKSHMSYLSYSVHWDQSSTQLTKLCSDDYLRLSVF